MAGMANPHEVRIPSTYQPPKDLYAPIQPGEFNDAVTHPEAYINLVTSLLLIAIKDEVNSPKENWVRSGGLWFQHLCECINADPATIQRGFAEQYKAKHGIKPDCVLRNKAKGSSYKILDDILTYDEADPGLLTDKEDLEIADKFGLTSRKTAKFRILKCLVAGTTRADLAAQGYKDGAVVDVLNAARYKGHTIKEDGEHLQIILDGDPTQQNFRGGSHIVYDDTFGLFKKDGKMEAVAHVIVDPDAGHKEQRELINCSGLRSKVFARLVEAGHNDVSYACKATNGRIVKVHKVEIVPELLPGNTNDQT